jgi:superfamily II DNA or RNA helicase
MINKPNNITQSKNNTQNKKSVQQNQLKSHLTCDGYNIPVDSISKEILQRTINDLTVFPYKLDATKEDIEASKFPVYKYSADRLHIIVPRFYGIYKFGKPQKTTFDPEEIDIPFAYALREKQKLVADKCIKYILKNGGGLLSVPCGFGKTVCALYMAHVLGLKTLIVVHKSNLLCQWITAIKNVLGLEDDRIGVIRQKVCKVQNKDIVVGMIQTISKREYIDVFNQFGLVIYDEAHHVACKYHSKSLLKTGAQYMLALTATPYRGDCLIKVMYWFTGGTIYRERVKMNKNVIVKMIHHRSNDQKRFALKMRFMLGQVRPDTGKMVTNICEIESRNDTIIAIINHVRKTDPDRKILILSERKSHLGILKQGVDLSIQEDIANGIIDEGEIYSCFYTGDTKANDRIDVETRGDIVFATYSMASEGVSIDHLNTVIIASPKKDVLQSVGRIMRTLLRAGDIRPAIIDIGDDVDCIKNWVKTRNIIYSKSKYEIENYYLIDDKFKSSLEFRGIDLDNHVDMHHKNMYLNRIMNDFNKDMNMFKKELTYFRQTCMKIENLQTDENLYHSLIEKNNYVTFTDLEYTDISDILHIKKITESDINRTVLKDADDNDELNLDEDLEFDKEEIENERNVLQSMSKVKSKMLTKKLF